MISNNVKLELCYEHFAYLFVINAVANKMMLREQFIQVILALGIDKTRKTIANKLLELKKADIIKEQRFIKNSRFIILKKFAIKFIEEEWSLNNSVASTRIPTSNGVYYKNIFKSEYFLKEIIPKLKKEKVDLGEIEVYLKYESCSFLMDGENFMWGFYERFFMEGNEKEIKNDAKLLQQKKETQRKILRRQLKNAEFIKREEPDISYLLVKNIIVDSCELDENKGEFVVRLNYMDFRDKQDIEDIISVYAIAYEVFRRLLKYRYNIYINIKVCTQSEQASKNIMKNLTMLKSNEANGEHRKIDILLNKYNVSPVFLIIQLENYDIANKYFK